MKPILNDETWLNQKKSLCISESGWDGLWLTVLMLDLETQPFRLNIASGFTTWTPSTCLTEMSWRRFTRRQGCRRCVVCAGSCKSFRKLSKIHCQGTDQYIPAVALVGMSWITGCEPFEHCRAQDPALVGLGLLPRACCCSPTVGMGQNLRNSGPQVLV